MNFTHQLQVECQGKETLKILITEKEGIKKKRRIKTWSSPQDQKLIQLHNWFPKKWTVISELMGDRNQNQCLHRHRRLISMEQGQKIWSQQQDEIVLSLIRKLGKNWKKISETIKTKNGKQIRQRYINKLDPTINKQDWSEQEDLLLISLYVSMGSKWSEIAKKLPGRPQNRIKNRFYSYVKRVYNISDISNKSKDEAATSFTQSPNEQIIQKESTEQDNIPSKQSSCKTLKQDEIFMSLIDHTIEQGLYKSAYEDIESLDFITGLNFNSIYQ